MSRERPCPSRRDLALFGLSLGSLLPRISLAVALFLFTFCCLCPEEAAHQEADQVVEDPDLLPHRGHGDLCHDLRDHPRLPGALRHRGWGRARCGIFRPLLESFTCALRAFDVP